MTTPRKPRKAGSATTRTMTTSPAPAKTNKSRRLEVFVKPGETQDRAIAGMMARGLVTNATTAIWFLQAEHDDLSLMDMARELRTQGEAVNRGDFSVSEQMLNAQAVALNSIFSELARRAALNMGTHLPATETYMRLALKAQGQCRATLETLAAMKNPPVVFARQANIAHGPQQVNNDMAVSRPLRAGARPHAANSTITPKKLLEDRTHGGTQLDTRAAAAAGRTNPGMEPLEAVNGPAKR